MIMEWEIMITEGEIMITEGEQDAEEVMMEEEMMEEGEPHVEVRDVVLAVEVEEVIDFILNLEILYY